LELRNKAKRRRRHRNKHRNDVRGQAAPLLVNRHNPEQRQPKNRKVDIHLHERIDLEENYERTITDLTNVRRAVANGVNIPDLDFSRLGYISPSAALLLASEVDSWKAAIKGRRGRLRAKTDTWTPSVKKLLCQMGFFELLGMKRPEDPGIPINTTFLPFIRRNVTDARTSAGEMAKELRKQIESVAGVEIVKQLLFEGLSEAITNVSQHAYSPTDHVRDWWMSGAIDKGLVIVSFYDHGRTIPGTLPASKIFEKIKDRFGGWNDGEKIRAAMEVGRSSTGIEGRGKGLQNFLQIIRHYPGSRLRIFSNRGRLTVSNTPSGLVFESGVAESPLLGTLIEWQFVPIKPEEQ
jgi:hypothetical protein